VNEVENAMKPARKEEAVKEPEQKKGTTTRHAQNVDYNCSYYDEFVRLKRIRCSYLQDCQGNMKRNIRKRKKER